MINGISYLYRQGRREAGRWTLYALCLTFLTILTACSDSSTLDAPDDEAADATVTSRPSDTPEPTPVVVGDCRDGMRLQPGEGCRYTGGGSDRPEVLLSVQQDGTICREGGPAQHLGVTVDNLRVCVNRFEQDDAFESDIGVRQDSDGSWTFYESRFSMPAPAQRGTSVPARRDGGAADGSCQAGMTLNKGDHCTVNIPGISVGTDQFEIRDDGYGCYGGLCSGKSVNLNGFQASRNSDDSWTISALPGEVERRVVATPTPASTPEPTVTPTPTPTLEPAATPTPTPTPTLEPAATPTPTPPSSGGPCQAGMVLDQGDYCTVDIPGVSAGTDRFEIRDDGFGCYGGICSGNSVNLNGFQASRNTDDSWTISGLPGGSSRQPTPSFTPTPAPNPTDTPTPTPEPSGPAVTGEITTCEGTQKDWPLDSQMDVTIGGRLYIHHDLLSLRIEGTANGEHIGSDFFPDLKAGQSISFTLGTFSVSVAESIDCNVSMDWTEWR